MNRPLARCCLLGLGPGPGLGPTVPAATASVVLGLKGGWDFAKLSVDSDVDAHRPGGCR